MSEFAFLAFCLKSHRRLLGRAVAVSVLESAVALSLPWFGGAVAAAVLGERLPISLLAAWVGVLFVQMLLTVANGRVFAALGEHFAADLSVRVHDHLLALPLAWHQARTRGDALSLLDTDVWRVTQYVVGSLGSMLATLFVFVGALAMLLSIEPRIGAALVLIAPLYAVGLKWAGRRLRPLEADHQRAYADRFALAERHFSVLPLVKAFAREPLATQRYRDLSDRVAIMALRQHRIDAALAPVVRFVSATAVIVLIGFAAQRIARGDLQPAALVSLLLYGLLLTQPAAQIAGLYGRTQVARGALRRLSALLAEAPEPNDGTHAPDRVRGDIVFDDVSFAYPGRPAVLRGLSLHIEAGETVAITGVNGAGKSTLTHLLMRFADPDSGGIRIDGTDLREWRIGALRSHIGWVGQQVLLLNDSVAANIGFGRIGADAAAIEAAARAAHAHDFIQRLPMGYDTRIGDDGIRLSGGQKQRLALARALLKDPAILVLDEATAMFDPDGERDFIAECRRLLRHRTVVLITHRPASLALADRVLRMDQGRLLPT